MSLRTYAKFLTSGAVVALAASGCAGSQGSVPATPGSTTVMQTARAPGASPAKNSKSILAQLKNQVVIGSTIDSVYGQLNPYGLDVAKSTNGAFTKGDLAVCNFNDNSNTQGTGYTIVALHPTPGSSPALVAADPTTLTGCDALALGPDDTMYAAAFSSNDNPVFSSSGMLETNLSGPPFNHPFGQIYAQPQHGENGQGQNGQDDQNGQGQNGQGNGNKHASAAVYESNAGDGSIVRIDPKSLQSEVVATGFPVNGGPPGSILGPSGLQYEAKHDTLFVVDGQNNSVTELTKVSGMHGGCLKVRSNGTQFDGPCKSHAKVLFSGPPLNGPISSALLFNGSIVIGNTLDATGENLMIEIGANGKLLDVRNVDTGPGGSLFGMVATGTNAANTKLYFNDDNDNNLQVLEH